MHRMKKGILFSESVLNPVNPVHPVQTSFASRSSRFPRGRCCRPMTPQYRPGFLKNEWIVPRHLFKWNGRKTLEGLAGWVNQNPNRLECRHPQQRLRSGSGEDHPACGRFAHKLDPHQTKRVLPNGAIRQLSPTQSKRLMRLTRPNLWVESKRGRLCRAIIPASTSASNTISKPIVLRSWSSKRWRKLTSVVGWNNSSPTCRFKAKFQPAW